MRRVNAITIDGVRYDYDSDPRQYCKTCALGDAEFKQRHGKH